MKQKIKISYNQMDSTECLMDNVIISRLTDYCLKCFQKTTNTASKIATGNAI
jgi:hypothetical protein